jgi:hypothetical protein
MSDELETTEISIVQQGPMRINHAIVCERGENVVAIVVDMASKRGAVCGEISDEDGVPAVMIEANEHSLHLDEKADTRLDTMVAFPAFKGWRVWCADVSKYSVYVCLVRRDSEASS